LDDVADRQQVGAGRRFARQFDASGMQMELDGALESMEEPAPYTKVPFPLSPSVGAWLRSRPARVNLANALAVVAAEVPAHTFPLHPSIGSWLQQKPAWSLEDSLERSKQKIAAVEKRNEEKQKRREELQTELDAEPDAEKKKALLDQIAAVGKDEDASVVAKDDIEERIKELEAVVEKRNAEKEKKREELKAELDAEPDEEKKKALLDQIAAVGQDEDPSAVAQDQIEEQEKAESDARLVAGPYSRMLSKRISDKVSRPTTPEKKGTLGGDFRKVSTSFDTIYAKFSNDHLTPKVEEVKKPVQVPLVQLEPSVRDIETRPVSPPAGMDVTRRPQKTSPRQPDARFRTNAGATREQVLNFAQSLTSSIFRNSNTLAMTRAASQPQLRKPSPRTMPAAPAMQSSSSATQLPVAAMEASSGATQLPSATMQAPLGRTLPPRPQFRKQCSPIPAEEGAFFD